MDSMGKVVVILRVALIISKNIYELNVLKSLLKAYFRSLRFSLYRLLRPKDETMRGLLRQS